MNLMNYFHYLQSMTYAQAGVMYSIWGTVLSITSILIGGTVNSFGLRNSLYSGVIISLLGRILMINGTNTHNLMGIFVVQPIGTCLVMSVVAILAKRMPSQDTIYSHTYAAMNVGAFVASLTTDALHSYASQEAAYNTFFYIIVFVSILNVLVTVSLTFPDAEESPNTTCSIQEVRDMIRSPVFVRVLVFALSLTGTRFVMKQLEVGLPVYMDNLFGSHAHYGAVVALNPLITITCVSRVQEYARRFELYSTILYGTIVVAASPTPLVLLPPSYFSTALFVILLTVGEMLYSPASIELTMRLSPLHKEGLFASLGAIPLFFVKILSGATTGALISEFCTDTCNSLWIVIVVISLLTPIILAATEKWFHNPEVKRSLAEVRGT